MNESDRPDDARTARLAERLRWRTLSDAELVAAVRKGSYEALRELYARFEPLLARYAARAGVSLESWEEDAHDVFCDVVLSLIAVESGARPRAEVRDIHSYIQRAFRNRMLDARRASSRREQRDARASSSDTSTSERIVLASCSESAIRASASSQEAPSLSTALARLATVLDAELSASERQMLTWVGNAVPMREIAQWLAINYSAAKVRLSRTRSRLRACALRHVNECTGAEREELLDFFHRSAGEMRRATSVRAHDAVAVEPRRMAEPGGAHGDD